MVLDSAGDREFESHQCHCPREYSVCEKFPLGQRTHYCPVQTRAKLGGVVGLILTGMVFVWPYDRVPYPVWW